MAATPDRNTDLLVYLQARYSVTNKDLQTLIERYMKENPSGLVDRQNVWNALQLAAAR